MPNTNKDDVYISKRPFAFELQETQTQKTNKNIKSVSRDYRDFVVECHGQNTVRSKRRKRHGWHICGEDKVRPNDG